MRFHELGLLLGAGASALIIESLSSSSSSASDVQCVTIQGTQSTYPIPTVTAAEVDTITLPDATTTTTITPVETTTEVPTITDTSTEVVTETTTDPAVTGTYSTTSTETDTDTVTEFATVTETETVVGDTTTVTSTSTIAAPPGFLGAQDTINGYPTRPKRELSQLGRKRSKCAPKTPLPSYSASATASYSAHPSYPAPSSYSAPPGSYSAPPSSYSAPPSSSSSSSSDGGLSTSLYPQSVECKSTTTVQSTATETVTESTVTSVTTAPAVTETVTETSTSTSTVIPDDVTVTESFTDTTTATTTTTSIETETSTTTTTAEATETANFYAACDASNMIGPRFQDLGPIVNVYNRGRGSATIYDYAEAASPYDCCVACINKSDCSGTIFRSGQSYCLLMYNEGRTCPAQNAGMASYVYQDGSISSSGFILSNGQCGYVYNGGSA